MRLIARGLLATLAVSACAVDPPSPETESRAIVGGSPASDPAVAALVARRSLCEQSELTLLCSATLIAPRVAVTAGHCLDVFGDDGAYELVFGAAIDDPAATFVVVTSAERHPDLDPVTYEYDIALLLLAEEAPVAPMLPATTADGLELAAAARAVGFGQTKATDPEGVKRAGTMEVSAINDASFEAVPAPGMSCIGDSGGPVLIEVGGEERLLGITVSGDVGCDEYSLNVRVDALASFTDPFVAAAASAPPGRSPDALDHAALCTEACETDADCPDGLHCQVILDLPGQCVLAGLTAGSFGDSCTGDATCGDGSSCARLWPSGPDACRCHVACDSAPEMPNSGGGGFCSASGEPPPACFWILIFLAYLGRARDRSNPRPRR